MDNVTSLAKMEFPSLISDHDTILAPYAVHAVQSRGRNYPEIPCTLRSHYQRDRERIIHSVAFRRLKHKTQVFVSHEGDHYRTRLTHSLEVAQNARTLARLLKLNEDLTEALALAHDLGHSPFGHAGEAALHEVYAPFGGFNHNDQTFRVLTILEKRYAEFDGLNLSWETLEGVVKHNGPITTNIPKTIENYNKTYDLMLHTFPSAEAQIAALADDIAYHCHDIDDGLKAGLFTIADIKEIPLIGDVFKEKEHKYPNLDQSRLIYECVRQLSQILIRDAYTETRQRITKSGVRNVDDVRHLTRPVAGFSSHLADFEIKIRKFMKESMYNHYKVLRRWVKGKEILQDLFKLFLEQPKCLPTEWSLKTKGSNEPETARIVVDYIAGMTDRYAIEEHQRIYNLYHPS